MCCLHKNDIIVVHVSANIQFLIHLHIMTYILNCVRVKVKLCHYAFTKNTVVFGATNIKCFTVLIPSSQVFLCIFLYILLKSMKDFLGCHSSHYMIVNSH